MSGITIQVGGVEYGLFTNALVSIRLDALSNTFSFSATSNQAQLLPFRLGEACQVLVDGDPVVTGFIELINVDGDSSTHTIDIQGRDKTGDLLDSGIASLPDLRPPISLSDICKRVIAHIGSDIAVVSEFAPPPFTKAEDLAAPEPGQNAFEFLEGKARKRQVLLTSNGTGDLVITRSSGAEVDATILHRVDDNDNNVIRYSTSYDSTGRFNIYKFVSQLNPIALINAGTSSNAQIVNQTAQSTDNAVRAGRQYVLVAENASSSSDQKERADWEANIRKARGNVYSATVHGFRNQSGELWGVNQLVQVIDDYADIDSRMLVNSVQFSVDPEQDGEGSQTVLSCVEKNAYTLELEEPVTDKVGAGTSFPLPGGA